jgi:hypothetical protein
MDHNGSKESITASIGTHLVISHCYRTKPLSRIYLYVYVCDVARLTHLETSHEPLIFIRQPNQILNFKYNCTPTLVVRSKSINMASVFAYTAKPQRASVRGLSFTLKHTVCHRFREERIRFWGLIEDIPRRCALRE